jgi:hypothetical protein
MTGESKSYEVIAIYRGSPNTNETVEAHTIEADSKADANQKARDRYGCVRVDASATRRVYFTDDGRRLYDREHVGEA